MRAVLKVRFASLARQRSPPFLSLFVVRPRCFAVINAIGSHVVPFDGLIWTRGPILETRNPEPEPNKEAIRGPVGSKHTQTCLTKVSSEVWFGSQSDAILQTWCRTNMTAPRLQDYITFADPTHKSTNQAGRGLKIQKICQAASALLADQKYGCRGVFQ